MKKIIDSIKYIKIYDILSVFIFIFMLPISLCYKLYLKIVKKEIWLITEEGTHARDNGYYFYKYMREKHPEEFCYYVIDKKSVDYNKVEKYGNIIQFRSFKHWLYYMSAKFNISSQKNGNPAQPLFYLIHVNLKLYNNRIFLQHGIIKDMCDWLLYKNTRFRCFICGAKKEYEYVKDNYGYPKNYVKYTGLARFDTLHDYKVKEKQILVMPTWRNWLGRELNNAAKKEKFKTTSFYKNWNEFLSSKELIEFIEDNNITILFYPHINMQKYLKEFNINSKNIKLVDTKTDIQEVLKSSALLITDYSSVYMDFGYMKKPIIYYQFDKEEYRQKQYQEGYFSYEKDGFGPIFETPNEVLNYIKVIYKNNIKAETKYLERMNSFFPICNQENSKRIYEAIKEIEG